MVSTPAYPNPNQDEFGYGQLFKILLRRWPWMLGALSLSLAGALYVNLQQEPEYESSMQLIVEPNFEADFRSTDLEDKKGSGSGVNEIDYATQLALMRSDRFLVEATDLLRDVYPDLSPDAIKPTFTLNQVEGEKATTRIFQATYVANDPLKAQQFLEALQGVYTRYNLKQQQERLSQGLSYVDDQLVSTQGNLQRAQTSLEQFRRGENLLDPNQQGQVIIDALNQVQDAQRQLATDLNQTEARYQILESQLKLSPDSALLAARLSQADRVQSLLTQIQAKALEIAERQIVFTEQDPTVQKLEAEQQNQLQQLKREISYVVRQPVKYLDPQLLSYIQLRSVDLDLVGQLLTTDADLATLSARGQSLITLEAMLRQELEKFPSLIAEYDRLQPEVEIQRDTLQRLLEQREQLTAELARGGYTWEIIQPPRYGRKIGPDPNRNLLLGTVVGLFLGGLLAFARESVDQVMHTAEDLQQVAPLPLLGVLPYHQGKKRLKFGQQAADADLSYLTQLHPELAASSLIKTIANPQFREAMDIMASLLQLQALDHPAKTIAITSAIPGEGKTTVTLSLALSLARMGQRVLLIDADMRKSGLQTQLNLANHSGLSTFLQGQPMASRTHRLDLGVVFVDVLPAGPVPDDPVPLLSSQRFKRLIAKSRQMYDIVLVDTPPVLGMADAVKVGSICDGTVLVARLERITRRELEQTLALVTPLNMLGMMANGARRQSNRYGYYGYGYGYGYNNGASKNGAKASSPTPVGPRS